jgi:hypothetical protein
MDVLLRRHPPLTLAKYTLLNGRYLPKHASPPHPATPASPTSKNKSPFPGPLTPDACPRNSFRIGTYKKQGEGYTRSSEQAAKFGAESTALENKHADLAKK